MFKPLSVSCVLFFVSLLANARQLVDPLATKATRELYSKLGVLSKRFTIFGQQDALAYGVGWRNEPGRADVKSVVKDHPGVYGWDIAHLELDSLRNIDKVPFEKMKQFIREGHQRGGIITISWHARNPLSAGSAWDTTPGTVAAILPGGEKHALYKGWLDRVALFMNDLRDSNGEFIPVLFRPFHELTGNWFWWCRNVCTPEQFSQLWRFTVKYLRDEKKIHHLLYVYNTSGFHTEAELMERYPGDDMTDLITYDSYQHDTSVAGRKNFIQKMRWQCETICRIAAAKHKIAAIGETGLEAVPDAKWWTGVLWPIVKDLQIAYVLVWRNEGFMPSQNKMHYYAPYPKQVSAKDFKKFYGIPAILFEKRLKQQLQSL